MSTSSRLGFQFSLFVIPRKQESRINSEMQKLLDIRLRGYDRVVEFIFLVGSCSLCSRFAYFRFASRRVLSTIPEGDTKYFLLLPRPSTLVTFIFPRHSTLCYFH
jgi:hypothetical protein